MSDFAQPLDVARLMAGFGHPWYIAGGWAIDLFLGRVTRRHSDIEVAVLRQDQRALRDHLRGWRMRKVVPGPNGRRRERWAAEEWLELPVHELHGERPGDGLRLEVLLNEASAGRWLFRRNPSVTLPLSRLGLMSAAGVPVLSPQVVLLYKAKNHGENDEQDFQNAAGSLSEAQRRWLRSAIERCHPGHRWLRELK